jgi:predicted RNase H-like HicB family nuclease
MATRYYTAVIERAASGGYGVFFPDLPGCTSAGSTIEEAARNAEEALRGHVELMLEDGEPLPNPTAPETIRIDTDVDEAARMLVRLDLPGRAVRVNISIEETLVAAVDKAAEQRGMSRSAFLAEAARRALRDAKG